MSSDGWLGRIFFEVSGGDTIDFNGPVGCGRV